MTDTAIATPDKPPKQASKRRISPKIAEAVRLITTGEVTTQKAAAERVGLNVSYLCEALKKPHIQVFIEHETRKTIGNAKMRASARLVALLDASSEHVSLDAVKHTLSIAGIAPPDRSQPLVNIAISPGYVVKLRHADDASTHGARADTQPQVIDNVEDDT